MSHKHNTNATKPQYISKFSITELSNCQNLIYFWENILTRHFNSKLRVSIPKTKVKNCGNLNWPSSWILPVPLTDKHKIGAISTLFDAFKKIREIKRSNRENQN